MAEEKTSVEGWWSFIQDMGTSGDQVTDILSEWMTERDDLRERVLALEEEINGTAGFLHAHGLSVSPRLADWDRKSMGQQPKD